MTLQDLSSHEGFQTTRRKIVKTGAKVAYAVPLIAASLSLNMSGAGAAISGGSSCSGSPNTCDVPFLCEGECFCFNTTEGTHLCFNDALCEGAACASSAECDPGFACTVTCCPGNPGTCRPACGLGDAAAGGTGPAVLS